MKKILVTGGSGFIAKSLAEAYSGKHEIVSFDRSKLDLLDGKGVESIIKSGTFDVVIHCATYDAAPKFTTNDPQKVLEYNLEMFFHLARCEGYFGKMIYFGSGAEFGREHWKPKMSEECFDENVPNDQYGFSKYIMTKYAVQSKNIYNLRLFGLFGKYDDWRYRLIPNLCARAALDMPLIINQNRVYDFMFIDDFAKIVQFFIENNPREKHYNICTGQTNSFIDIANTILATSKKELEIMIKQDGNGVEYSGSNERLLKEMNGFEFTSIELAISKLYNWYTENINILDRETITRYE